MTPEAQRIAIAEACGWTKCDRPGYDGFWKPEGYVYNHSPYSLLKRADEFPDYLNDLNAMHEVIRDKIAGDKELETRFVEELHKLQSCDADSEDVTPIFTYEMCDIIAECGWLSVAFLRTIGKWEE